jgi:hypothetical protein
MTTIKVTAETRDLVRAEAESHGVSQGELIDRAVRELSHREWLAEVAAWTPDAEYLAELREWDQADLGTSVG